MPITTFLDDFYVIKAYISLRCVVVRTTDDVINYQYKPYIAIVHKILCKQLKRQ